MTQKYMSFNEELTQVSFNHASVASSRVPILV